MYAALAILVGLALLVWGAAALAQRHGVPPLLIGMVVVGFGTSMPELMVSVLAGWQGSIGIALGNAYGSNIANIGCILGAAALIRPLAVHSSVLRKELPVLVAVTALSALLLWDGQLGRLDAAGLLLLFAGLMGWTIREGLRQRQDSLGQEMERVLPDAAPSQGRALLWTGLGLVGLLASSRLLVWGAVSIAQAMGVSDLVIGLTVVALGTSLPELASSVAAALRGEDDIAVGNVIGSNLFNTLMVVGAAGLAGPGEAPPSLLTRDMAVMGVFTLSLLFFGYGRRGQGRISRLEGSVLLLGYMAYTGALVFQALGK